MFGHWEILIVILVIVLLFGGKRLPRLMGDVAKGIRSFRQELSGNGEEEKPTEKSDKPEEKDKTNGAA